MKTHYCKQEKTTISYENECNWCGEKEMKQEPVAWTTKLQLEWLNNLKNNSAIMWNSNDRNKMGIGEESVLIPLYTAPRELSDEEIDEVASNFSELYESEARVYAAIEDAHGFARAILKKASGE